MKNKQPSKDSSKSNASKSSAKNQPQNQKNSDGGKDDRHMPQLRLEGALGKGLSCATEGASQPHSGDSEINIDPEPLPLEGCLHLHEPTTHVFLGTRRLRRGQRAYGGLVPRHRRIQPHDQARRLVLAARPRGTEDRAVWRRVSRPD
jgi:hypothetical protein